MGLPCGRGCWFVTGLLARREGSVPEMTFECALQYPSGGQKWNWGMCEPGLPVSADQVSAWCASVCTASWCRCMPRGGLASPKPCPVQGSQGTALTALSCRAGASFVPAPTQNHPAGVFVYFVYLCFHKWTQDGHLLPSLAKD